MRSTEERMALVMTRTNALTRRREHRRVAGLSVLSGCLLMALLTTIGLFSGDSHSLTSADLAGSSLLADSAGGYVLVAVLSFAAAVAITTLCFRLRRKHEEIQKKEQEEPAETKEERS